MNPISTEWGSSSTSSVRTLQRGSSNVVKSVDLTAHDDHDFDLFGVGAPTDEPTTNTHVTIKTVETVSMATIKSTDSIETASSFESLTETTVLVAETPTAYTLFPPAPATAPSTTFRLPSTAAKSLGVDDDDDDGVLFPTAGGIDSSYSSSASTSQYDADAAFAQALNYQLNSMSLAPPPPQFKNSGNAVDIIAAKSTDDRIFTTSWHVMFSWSRFRSNIYTGVGDTVRVLVNGKELPTKMVLQERGRCNFVTGGLTPPTTDLQQMGLFEDRPNLIRFEHFQKSSDTIRYVESRLHLWGPNESVVIADLDGTLTVSDVEGHIRTLRLGQYDFLHKGACDFFTKLHELDMRILYLTARPIDWATASRTHLENAKQQTHLLPPGPLVTNSNGLTGALLTEVVNKNPHVFKANVLNEIQLTLIHAGRVVDHPVFVAGFGNRPTDTIAYEQVGVSPDLIFLIDPYSNLKAVTNLTVFESYADPNALLWLLPKLKHKVPLEKVQRIDDYTVRELVLAEDREQLLMAEREARRLQEEEYERVTQRSNSGIPSLPGSSTALRPSYYRSANFSG